MAKPQFINDIYINADYQQNPLAVKAHLREYTRHPLCKARYRARDAAVLLEGQAPVLLSHRTTTGRTALFNIPPTAVRRDNFYERPGYGRNSISELINYATATMLQELEQPVVTTTAGKLLAFEDHSGHYHIIVMEDAFPEEPSLISPLVSINWPDIVDREISCDKAFHVLFPDNHTAQIRLRLEPHECAVISVTDR